MIISICFFIYCYLIWSICWSTHSYYMQIDKWGKKNIPQTVILNFLLMPICIIIAVCKKLTNNKALRATLVAPLVIPYMLIMLSFKNFWTWWHNGPSEKIWEWISDWEGDWLNIYYNWGLNKDKEDKDN